MRPPLSAGGTRLLRGFRGTPPTDPEPSAKILGAVGRLLNDHHRIVELDLNPVIAEGSKARAVDAVIVLICGPGDYVR